MVSEPHRSENLVLGINSVYHESSACLLDGARVLAFSEEERFSRIKRGKRLRIDNADALPLGAIDHCLSATGVTWSDIGHIAYSYDPDIRPTSRPAEDVQPGAWGSPEGERIFQQAVRRVPARLSQLAGEDVTGRFHWVPHHRAHAASAYFASPYDDAAVLTLDALGEYTSTMLARGRGTRLDVLHEISYPHSLGFLWETVSEFLGLDRYSGPAKVMGLAAFGQAGRFSQAMAQVIQAGHPDFRIDNRWTRFRSYGGDRLDELFGPRRAPGAAVDHRDADVARALQEATEEVLLALAEWLREQTGTDALCLAGGVALNCVATGRLARESGFSRVFVQPAANDAGTALGAALYLLHHEVGCTDRFVMRHPYFGPEFTEADLRRALDAARLPYVRCADVAAKAARLISDGGVIGWFQGAMEVGPRALGNRSILADPRRPAAKDIINLRAKHREYWRPFSPSVLKENAAEWLSVSAESPSHAFMSFTYPVRQDRRNLIPAAIHVDGHARAQLVTSELNPRYHRLIGEFRGITGVPVVLNTSFNGPDEPIVCSPEDAVATYQKSGLDALVLGDFLVTDRLDAGAAHESGADVAGESGRPAAKQ